MVVAVAVVLLVAAVVALPLLVRGPAVIRVPDGFESRPVSSERLEADVRRLCSEFSPRSYANHANLDRIAEWIAERFWQAGLEVTEQAYRLNEGEYRNVIGIRSGTDVGRGAVIVGAHYDAYGALPGADDNASGVAVLLELTRTLPDHAPGRTQIFVAFSTEEPPFFATPGMGSHQFARKLLSEGLEVELMIALDLVGCFSDEPGSQNVPGPLLRLAYPSRGNFIGVVGDVGAGRWIRRVKRGMRSANALPVYSFRAPSIVPGIDWSDHIWFRRLDLPGVLVTDTAMMRNPNYHRSTDTPDTLDYDRMAAVVQALHGVLQDE